MSPFLQTVSDRNSASLLWALYANSIGRVNDLRLGEAFLLGVDPVSDDRIAGMYQDTFMLVAKVIEAGPKTVGSFACFVDSGFSGLNLLLNSENTTRLILAVGHQDADITGLALPFGHRLVGATSDHLVDACHVRARHEDKAATHHVGTVLAKCLKFT